eukprot:gene14021-19957_t
MAVITCLGPPRQMLGLWNVPETCLPVVHEIDNPMFEKDMYTGSRGGAAPSIPEGEEYEMGPPPQMAPAPAPNPALSRRQTAEVESDGGDEFRRSPRDDFRQQSHGFGNNAGSSRQYSQEFGQHNNFNSGRAPAQNRPVSPSSRSRDPSQSRPISPIPDMDNPGPRDAQYASQDSGANPDLGNPGPRDAQYACQDSGANPDLGNPGPRDAQYACQDSGANPDLGNPGPRDAQHASQDSGANPDLGNPGPRDAQVYLSGLWGKDGKQPLYIS